MNKKSIISSLLLGAFVLYVCFFQMCKKTSTVTKNASDTSSHSTPKNDEQTKKYSFEMTIILSDTPSYKFLKYIFYNLFKNREKITSLESHKKTLLKKNEDIYSSFLDILFSCIISGKAP